MNKKRLISILSIMVLVIVLTLTLTSCLQIGLKKNQVISKLDDLGATYEYERVLPMSELYKTALIADAELQSGNFKYSYKQIEKYSQSSSDILTCSIKSSELDNTGDVGVDQESYQYLYIIYLNTEEVAESVEEFYNYYITQELVSEECKNWEVYRRDKLVLCGYCRFLAEIRGY